MTSRSPRHGLPDATHVVIAGGGPVGLAAAIELRQRGIDCLVIEPRTEVSHARPRCKTVNVRSMEHLRRWGVADRFRQRVPLPTSWSQDIVFCTSLLGYELSRFSGVLGLEADGDRFPELGQQAPQYLLEELLRDVVSELAPGSLHTGSAVVGVEQDDREARVTVADAAGEPATITADYVLGCDGPRSAVREAIGASYVGDHALRPNFGMVFHAPDLMARCAHGPAVQYWVVNRLTPALMGPIDLVGTWWIIAFNVDRETGERNARALIEGAAGAPVAATVLSDDPWTARMQLVDRARSGRVFLAGDAAHLNPPFGGHGLNTGLGDAVDLGWKLAAVIEGWGGPSMLESYEAERRPVQTAVIEAAVENMKVLATDLVTEDIDAPGARGDRARRRAHANIQATKHAEFHSLSLVLDLAYDRSPIVVAADQPRPAPGAARPGARLPHAWLGPGQSLYDELHDGLSLLVLAGGHERDVAAFAGAAREVQAPLGVLDLAGRGLHGYGAELVLVRPDQHVAWCSDQAPVNPRDLIDQVRGAAVPAHR